MLGWSRRASPSSRRLEFRVFVDALQMALDRPHRDATISGNLLVRTAGCGLHGGVELAAGKAGLGRDGSDRRRGSSLAMAQKLRRPVFVGRRVPGPSAAS